MGVSVPAHTQAEGVTWLDEGAIVRAGTSGFLGHFLAEPGSQVTVGDPLLVSYDPALAAQVRLAEARLREAQATYGAELVAGRAEAQIARERLLQSRAELATLRERTEGLTARARAEGTFVVPQAADMPERYFRKGEVVGYVIGPARPIVRVVVPQEAVARVRSADPQVELRVVDRPLEPLTGRVVREVPAGDEYLPSRALAVEGGGSIATDPRDTRGARSLQRMFQFDVALDQAPDQHQFGVRTLVRFAHRDEPLGVQWLRGVRLIFLSHFGV
jgi:putative peptide zinc metalloprotease protein